MDTYLRKMTDERFARVSGLALIGATVLALLCSAFIA